VSATRLDRATLLGGAAALSWVLAIVRWFDAGAPFRPSWLESLPPSALFLAALVAGLPWLAARAPSWRAGAGERVAPAMALALLATLFRLPLAWHGAAGYTTADGALSGLVALHVRDGGACEVFVPNVPYSGSLKAHVTAALAVPLGDLPRAFTLASVLFYAAFVAGLCRLGALAGGGPSGGFGVATGAGLFAAFAPTFVTQYSLSNDGNYVEVLCFGTWASVLAARWARAPAARPVLSLGIGLLLGLGFWCHVLAALYAAAVGVFLLWAAPAGAFRALPAIGAGFGLGDAPGLLWNATHSWDSFRSLIPGQSPAQAVGADPSLPARLALLFREQLPVLLGYDPGYPRLLDLALWATALAATGLAVLAVGAAVVRAVRRGPPGALHLLLLVAAIDVAVGAFAMRHVPGNPRYLLFLMTPLPVLLAALLIEGRRRVVLGALIGVSAVASLGQWQAKRSWDQRWRGFVRDLEAAGVRRCYSDFYLATRINFLSEERIVCSAKLGPSRTEYFFEYREAVDRAPAADYVAVSSGQARRLAARLQALGVGFERRDLMRPVLLRLSRKVDPSELFPGESFGLR
jgi:hypothetical protein